jgi:methyl-accepting chemotaxis protein
MTKDWTYAQRLAAGYAVMVVFAILISTVAAYALRTVVASKDRVTGVNMQLLLDAERLNSVAERTASSVRGYLLVREERFLEQLRESRNDLVAVMTRLKAEADTDEARRLLDAVARTSDDYRRVADEAIALARAQSRNETVARLFEQRVVPARERFNESVRSFVSLQERSLAEAKQLAADTVSTAVTSLIAMTAAAVLFAAMVAIVLTRSLSRQIGTAVGQVQSSSSELQAAATQQASGAKEQASAMNEISTTISELVASSRQIADSAQRVAQIAEQTAVAARNGEGTVERGQDSASGIRRQVDLVVNHMLDLGKKSQQIGAVLEIVSELAEQTNILSINATIEAAGAGETGRRFAVVADEIRKLADRVANSTKEIRALIDDIRGAVNTTVMATEGSAKAVDAGARQFAEVAVAFKQIAALVGTTTDAAREIELSTKQQATAADQVRIAVADVAQTTHETEASTGQTLQTASQLAGLSRELLRLIRPQAGGA